MLFKHIYDESLAQGSYMISCQQTKETLVIDPKRDIDTYLKIAEEKKLNITHITETHIHADFLSGSRELAAVTGAELLLSDEGGEGWQYEFPHTGLKDGDKIKIGNLSFKIMHTPGHTPESISFLLTDHPASDQPTMVFTGDFVFVGDVGRPDLLETAAGIKGTKKEGAKQMYDSLQKFAALPEYVQVWPAHGAGSACGKALGAVPSSTVGYEKIQNWALQYKDEDEFINLLLDGQPEPPKYFAKMKYYNKVDRPLLIEVPKHPKLSKSQFLSAYKNGMTIIDTRDNQEFAKGFIPNAINIEDKKSFSTWAGWVLDYQEQFMLIADEDRMDDLTRKLMRIGLDNVYGFITPADIHDLGVELKAADYIGYKEFKSFVDKPNTQIVDVRGNSEFKTGHVPGANHVFIGTIADNLDKIDKNKEIIVHCQSGTRSTVAYSILRKNGFENVKNFVGGWAEWSKNESEILA